RAEPRFRASSSGKADPSRLSAALAPVVLAMALLWLAKFEAKPVGAFAGPRYGPTVQSGWCSALHAGGQPERHAPVGDLLLRSGDALPRPRRAERDLRCPHGVVHAGCAALAG